MYISSVLLGVAIFFWVVFFSITIDKTSNVDCGVRAMFNYFKEGVNTLDNTTNVALQFAGINGYNYYLAQTKTEIAKAKDTNDDQAIVNAALKTKGQDAYSS